MGLLGGIIKKIEDGAKKKKKKISWQWEFG